MHRSPGRVSYAPTEREMRTDEYAGGVAGPRGALRPDGVGVEQGKVWLCWGCKYRPVVGDGGQACICGHLNYQEPRADPASRGYREATYTGEPGEQNSYVAEFTRQFKGGASAAKSREATSNLTGGCAAGMAWAGARAGSKAEPTSGLAGASAAGMAGAAPSWAGEGASKEGLVNGGSGGGPPGGGDPPGEGGSEDGRAQKGTVQVGLE